MKTLGASVGAAGVLGGSSLLSACNQVESASGDKITLLTSSGELVMVIPYNFIPEILRSKYFIQ